MNLELPLVHLCRQLISFSGCPVHSQSCSTQENDSSIKFYRTHQMAASTASPSSLFSTCWVFPVKGKCAAGSSQWTLLFPASLSICASKSGHRFPTIWVRAAQRTRLPLVPVSAQPPLPSLSPHSILLRQPHQALRSVRSFGLEQIDRSDQSAARHLQISKARCVQFLTI